MAGSGVYFIEDPGEPFGITSSLAIVDDNETLITISQIYDLGYNEITEANPGVDPWFPGKGRRVIIPTAWILPSFPDELLDQGPLIIINLAEFRLYRLWKTGGRIAVMTFPIGIGREGVETPTGVFRIVRKEKNPSWHIPRSIRDEYPHLPGTVPPGPENPLGSRALRLSIPEYLIHGTNRPLGIGRMVSHGCIRMYNRDVERLYKYVAPGDRILITYQPVKAGIKDGHLYIEVHRDFRGSINPFREAVSKLRSLRSRRPGILQDVETEILYKWVSESRGYPVKVGRSYHPETGD